MITVNFTRRLNSNNFQAKNWTVIHRPLMNKTIQNRLFYLINITTTNCGEWSCIQAQLIAATTTLSLRISREIGFNSTIKMFIRLISRNYLMRPLVVRGFMMMEGLEMHICWFMSDRLRKTLLNRPNLNKKYTKINPIKIPLRKFWLEINK